MLLSTVLKCLGSIGLSKAQFMIDKRYAAVLCHKIDVFGRVTGTLNA